MTPTLIKSFLPKISISFLFNSMEIKKQEESEKLESCPIKLLFPFFIGTGFPPFYRVIDPIARGKYAL